MKHCTYLLCSRKGNAYGDWKVTGCYVCCIGFYRWDLKKV
ncbi:hypothetical protein APHDU1_0014 [Anaplasma phagocytophilum]|nr:hypothetical protein APHDU1_0014 [Anaplasma phagocytophilum]